MRVADYIFKFLADHGVRHVFLVTGGGAMFLNDGLRCEKRITPICNHHEQGAAIAAEGYSRVTGELSVVSVTTGPGGTNAITGLIGEWLDSQPVLYISGQVKLPTTIASQPDLPLRQLGDQEINIVDLVSPVTKYAKMLTVAEDIGYELAKAVWLATHGRKGPVWLDIPINIQSAEIDESCLKQFIPPVEEDSQLCTTVFWETLEKAKAPVIIAGHGIRLAKAEKDFLSLAENLNIPVVATFNGFDLLPTDHPLMVGRIGTIGTRSGNIVLQNADWVLSLGSRNNIRQISYNYENFVRRAKTFICVDIDPAELEKHTLRPTHKVCSDAGVFIRKLLTETEKINLPSWDKWLEWSMERKRRYPVVLEEYKICSEGINPYVFTEILTEILDENAVVACANATPSLALFQAGIVKKNQRMFCNSGCAAMGYGFPAALGSAVAAAESGRQIVCLDGDGSMMMNLQEMQTVATNKLPVKLFLYNNNEYCSIRQTHDNFFKERIGCDASSGVEFPDWQLLAMAFRWKYYKIDSIESAKKIIPQVLAENEPVFCDVKLVPAYTFAPKLSSRRLPDGSIVSPSLEDMYPFLPEEEMLNNRFLPEEQP